MRRSIRSLKRRTETRRARAKFTLFCEGRNTEPEYFQAVAAKFDRAIVELEIIPAAGAPLTITAAATAYVKETAKAARRAGPQSYARRDQVWAVFDRDDHDQVHNCLASCEAGGVGVAFSNPCFELWLILHVIDFDAPIDRHKLQKELQKVCPEYDHSGAKKADCRRLVEALTEAEGRAERQRQRREIEDAAFGPPLTTVYELTRAIGVAAQDAG